MTNLVSGDIDDKLKKHFISACDIIMLNACFVALYYGLCYNNTDLLLVLLVFNASSIMILRRCLSHALQIPWLYSPFNRLLKRTTDICISILLLFTIFPLIYIFQTICIKKYHGGPVFEPCHIKINDEKVFTAIKFRNNSLHSNTFLQLAPIVFNIILGHFSLWDIKHIHEIENDTDNSSNIPEVTYSTEITNIPTHQTLTQSDYTENINPKN